MSRSRNFNRSNRGGYNRNFKYNKNQYIRAKKVRLIDDQGENVGVIDTDEALKKAKSKGLDLVEVAPNADPPVCKIIEWSKFKYEQEKKEKAKKKKSKDTKELKFSTKIAIGDKERRIDRAREFLDDGHNVKLTVFKRGRVPKDHVKDLMSELLTALSEYSTIESSPSFDGRRSTIHLKANSNNAEDKN